MKTKQKLFAPYGPLAFVCMFFMFLAICCVAFAMGCIYWTWMALLAIAREIRSSWRRLLNSGYGWSKRQRPLLPRSAYQWMRN